MQTAINEMEAKHRTIFVAGWRPFIGWVCGVALAYNFVLRDLFYGDDLSHASNVETHLSEITSALERFDEQIFSGFNPIHNIFRA